MKRIFFVFMCLMLITCFAGCDENQERININFIVYGESYLVEIDKGNSISKDIIPIGNNKEVIELYYDEAFTYKYDNEKIYNNITIYIKQMAENNLSKEIETKIKESYILNFCDKETKINEIIVERYYGNYNGFEVILIKELYKGDNGWDRDIIINNVVFHYAFGNREILLWTGKEFLTLDVAFEKKIITVDDLIKISEIHNKNFPGGDDE